MFSKEIKIEFAQELYFHILNTDIVDTYLYDLVYDFSSDYYIIGTYKAKEWLKKYFDDMLESIEWNKEMFDKDFSYLITEPEEMVNIVALAVIEEVLADIIYELDELELANNLVEEEDVKLILDKLKEIFKVK